MFAVADYYCALKALSLSLDGVLFRGTKLTAGILEDPIPLLGQALKLRHPTLYRECLVYALGPWKNPKFKKITDPTLSKSARETYSKICVKLVELQGQILDHLGFYSHPNSIHGELQVIASSLLDKGKVSQPAFYRFLYKGVLSQEIHVSNKLQYLLSWLLRNELKLEPSAITGEGDHKDHFLCITVEDEDLPWDPTQTDY